MNDYKQEAKNQSTGVSQGFMVTLNLQSDLTLAKTVLYIRQIYVPSRMEVDWSITSLMMTFSPFSRHIRPCGSSTYRTCRIV